ncbi:hypothetical protein K7432_007050 [Basidiobolus ranarum]|uniref:SAP domain-containing protein n=1 Tax=Basidiobolus ranarum TaxID=34480 RepID=A0ABR2WTW7_9FUNG
MAPLPSLNRFRKFELAEIAQALGLSTEGLRPDLEARIKAYLNENDISDNPDIVSLLNAPRVATPRKRVGRSTSPSSTRSTRSATRTKSVEPETLASKLTFRGRQQESSEPEDKQPVKYEIPEKQEFFIDAPESEKLKRMFKYEDPLASSEKESPSKSTTLDTTIIETKTVTETVTQSQTISYKNSQVWSVILFLFAVELISLVYSSFHARDAESSHFRWELYPHFILTLPDIPSLLTSPEFWRPAGAWLVVLVIVPFVISGVFNVERDHPMFSSLTFAVARSAIIYGLKDRADVFGQLYELIPMYLLHFTCAIGLILATYRGVSKSSIC